MEKTRKNQESGEATAEKSNEKMNDIIWAVIDKLAGKQSELKLSFQDLTLDVGREGSRAAKVKLNGAIVLNIVCCKETPSV